MYADVRAVFVPGDTLRTGDVDGTRLRVSGKRVRVQTERVPGHGSRTGGHHPGSGPSVIGTEKAREENRPLMTKYAPRAVLYIHRLPRRTRCVPVERIEHTPSLHRLGRGYGRISR